MTQNQRANLFGMVGFATMAIALTTTYIFKNIAIGLAIILVFQHTIPAIVAAVIGMTLGFDLSYHQSIPANLVLIAIMSVVGYAWYFLIVAWRHDVEKKFTERSRDVRLERV